MQRLAYSLIVSEAAVIQWRVPRRLSANIHGSQIIDCVFIKSVGFHAAETRRSPGRIISPLPGRHEVKVHHFKPEADDPLHKPPQGCLVRQLRA
jgi:hypothetical protein